MFLLSQLERGAALSIWNPGGTLGEEGALLSRTFPMEFLQKPRLVAHGGQQCPVASNFPQAAPRAALQLSATRELPLCA